MNLIKSTGTFSFFTTISRILGYIRDILIDKIDTTNNPLFDYTNFCNQSKFNQTIIQIKNKIGIYDSIPKESRLITEIEKINFIKFSALYDYIETNEGTISIKHIHNYILYENHGGLNSENLIYCSEFDFIS